MVGAASREAEPAWMRLFACPEKHITTQPLRAVYPAMPDSPGLLIERSPSQILEAGIFSDKRQPACTNRPIPLLADDDFGDALVG